MSVAVVTDRTVSDVMTLHELRKKIIERTATSAEWDVWISNLKGAYNASDLNRVEENTRYLAELLNRYGYAVSVETKTNWSGEDIPNDADLERYINNLQALVNAYYTLPTSPPLPDSMDRLSYQGANAIEQIQADINQLTEWLEQSFVYANQAYSGEAVDHAGIRFVTPEQIPPENVSGIDVRNEDGKILIKWSDPKNTTDENGAIVSRWAGTKLIRKTGGFPGDVDDGTLVYDNTARNAFKDTPFVDDGLGLGVTYYYQLFPYNTVGGVNENAENRFSVYLEDYKVFGVQIDMSNPNPETSVTYTDDAVGMTGGSSAWDAQPIFKDIKPCVFKDGAVQYYLNPDNFAQKADGTAADITSGNDGDVMIEIPKVGFAINTSGNTLTVKVTDNPDDAANFKYYAHTRVTEGDRDRLYIGAYLGFTSSGKLRSLSGKTPSASQTIGTFRGQAQTNGAGYDIVSFYPLTLLQSLFIVKYKHLNTQVALGRGFVDDGPAVLVTGGTNAKGMNYGETTGKQQMKFHGIEDMWGNLVWWIDGLYSDGSRNMLTAFDNFNNTGSGYANRGQGATANINGYMSKPQGTSEAGFVAKEVTGSETTYFADAPGLYSSSFPYYGGYRTYGNVAGAFFLSVTIPASLANETLGARLMYL